MGIGETYYSLRQGRHEAHPMDQYMYPQVHRLSPILSLDIKTLITKELFDKAQETRHVWKGVWGSKDFIFKGKFRCGKCGTLIIGQEKYKKQKNGSFKRHVYYTCTGRTKRDCKQPYINEVNMCVILKEFVEINYKKLKLSDELNKLIIQHRETASMLMKHYDIERDLEHPIIEFTRYVLTKGLDEEKLHLVSGIESKLTLKDEELRFYRPKTAQIQDSD